MTYNTDAIILKTYEWPRNARLYILYTKKFGKVKAVARGASKIKSKVAGHLQPFSLAHVMIASGRRIDRLAQARLHKQYPVFYKQWPLFMTGSYILEVLERLTKEMEPDQRIWESTLQIFEQFQRGGEWMQDLSRADDLEKFTCLSRLFTFSLLDRLGYRPELFSCIDCKTGINDEAIHFSIIHGGLVCQQCQRNYPESFSLSREAVKLLRIALSRPMKELAKIHLSSNISDAASSIIDQLVAIQLQRPLRSAQIF